MKAGDDFEVITKTYDLCLWFLPLIAKMPRAHRFTLGDRLEVGLLDLLERLIEARYVREKAELLRLCNLRIEKLRFVVRLAKDLDLVTVARYEHVARQLDGIGRQVGGWARQASGRSS